MESSKERPHPLYGEKDIRATYAPLDPSGLNPGTEMMVGHEFVWHHIGWDEDTPIWTPADPEDINAYFEVVGTTYPGASALCIAEDDLEIFRVEKLDA